MFPFEIPHVKPSILFLQKRFSDLVSKIFFYSLNILLLLLNTHVLFKNIDSLFSFI